MQSTADTESDPAAGLIPARIVAARVRDGYTVALEFADGFRGSVDFGESIRSDRVTAALRDPAAFSSVRIGPRGRSLEWPGDIDFCADALRLRARPE